MSTSTRRGKQISEGKQGTRSTSPADEYLCSRASDTSPVLSVVLPTLNEEEGIETCITQIKDAIAELEVPAEIIISDSSTDRTPDIAGRMGAIVFRPDDPGYGYAYRYAFERARGDYIVMGDADCTYPFEEIPRLLERVREGDADIVMGDRLNGEIEPGAMPALHKHIGNPLLTKFLNAFYDAGVNDAHSGFRIFTRDALETMNLESDGMEFASEMIMDAGARDLEIDEVPIEYRERKGDATLESFRDGWRHVRFMLLNAPGYLFSIPGIVLAGFGLLVMGLAYTGIEIGGVSVGIHSMVAGSLFTIVGTQVAMLGVFAKVAANPIRAPEDPVSDWIADTVRLEHGATAGVVIAGSGAVYSLYLLSQWIGSGFSKLPLLMSDVIGFTAIVLGLQVVFGSFFLSVIASD